MVCGENIRLRSHGSVSRMARNEARPILVPFRLSDLFPGCTPTVTMATILNVYPVHSLVPVPSRRSSLYGQTNVTDSSNHAVAFGGTTAFGTVLAFLLLLLFSFSCLSFFLSLSVFPRDRARRLSILHISLSHPQPKQNVSRIAIVYISLHPSCPTSKQPVSVLE